MTGMNLQFYLKDDSTKRESEIFLNIRGFCRGTPVPFAPVETFNNGKGDCGDLYGFIPYLVCTPIFTTELGIQGRLKEFPDFFCQDGP